MAEWKKTLPNIDVDSKPYWDACKEHRLIIQQCQDCGKLQHLYRKDFCCHCWSQNVVDVDASGNGKVWTYTITYLNYTPGFAEDTPYVTALIELEEGLEMLSGIINIEPEKIEVNMPVKVTWVEATNEITIPFFEPA